MNDAQPVLGYLDAERRSLLLEDLQAALARRGVHAVVARHHRLVLTSVQGYGQSGPTEPELHAFTAAGTRKITTDGRLFCLHDGQKHPVTRPEAAADAICQSTSNSKPSSAHPTANPQPNDPDGPMKARTR